MAEPRESRVLDDPPAIAHLRDKLAHEHALASADPKALFATLVGKSMRELGVRPQILERREDGTRVYGLTRDQAQRVVDRHDELRDESLAIHGIAGIPTEVLAAGCRRLLNEDLPDDPAEAAKMAAPLKEWRSRWPERISDLGDFGPGSLAERDLLDGVIEDLERIAADA